MGCRVNKSAKSGGTRRHNNARRFGRGPAYRADWDNGNEASPLFINPRRTLALELPAPLDTHSFSQGSIRPSLDSAFEWHVPPARARLAFDSELGESSLAKRLRDNRLARVIVVIIVHVRRRSKGAYRCVLLKISPKRSGVISPEIDRAPLKPHCERMQSMRRRRICLPSIG